MDLRSLRHPLRRARVASYDLRRPLLLLCAALHGGAGCHGPDADASATDAGGQSCPAELDEGALVITEVMPDPSGADSGKEWFELHNPGAEAVNLKGAVLTLSKANGESQKSHTIAVDLEIPPGGYVTLGDVLTEARPPHVDYGYAAELGAMNNTAGRLRVICGDTVVDQILYSDVKSSRSRALDGRLEPDAIANEDQAAWCLGADLYDAVAKEYGTPRAPNPPCPLPPPPTGQCYEGETLRAIVPPTPGQLVISEFHPNPAAVDDTDGEWFEVTALARVDLNGLQIGKEIGAPLQTVEADDYPHCVTVEAGGQALFAREADPEVNGGLPPVDVIVDFSLTNSASSLYLADAQGTLLDAITYATSGNGAATSLDPMFVSVDGNDDPLHWCLAVDPYGLGDLGTPRAPNPACALPPPTDECLDNGAWRKIRSPVAGDLVIDEVMADPSLTPDADGEWIELYVGADVDLNRLVLGTDPGTVKQILGATDPTCLAIAAGTRVVLARDVDPEVNGGLPAGALGLGFSLTNSGSNLHVSLPGPDEATPGPLLDSAAYVAAKAGLSLRLDDASLDPAGNDDPLHWCLADLAQVYGVGDHGTPGAPNGSCGIVEAGLCDDAGVMRAPIPPGPGDLVITEYMADPKAVADASGEWFELLVTQDVDLNGLQLGKQPDKVEATLAAAECLHYPAGSSVVFARSADPAVNGGLPQVDFVVGFSLVNSAGGLFAGIADVILDEVDYATSTPGAATSRDPNLVDWCPATAPYGLGDLGTPGAANPACGGGMGDQCLDQGVPRAIVKPAIGDLLITEVMADPKAVADAAGEWFELRALKSIDLNGLRVAKLADGLMSAAPLASESCLHVDAGAHLLFAHSADPAVNGGLPTVDYTFTFGLTNTNGGVAVGVEDLVLDATTYVATQPAGKARALDPGITDPAQNDDGDGPSWCTAIDPYGLGDLGTPRAANKSCG
ncbi:MAG: lamin tail domain-containing protein [Nannocystaceae bacterium]